jgi:hypothetical protein
MALPATDNFNRDNGPLITGNWEGFPLDAANPTIVSSAVTSSAADDASGSWTADNPNNDQYAQVVISTVADNGGPMVRNQQSPAMEGVIGQYNNNTMIIYWYHSSWTQVGSTYVGVTSNGDTLKLTAVGTTFTMYKNGTSRVLGSNASAPSSGWCGLQVSSTSIRLDDFECGNLGGGAAGVIGKTIIVGNQSIVRSTVW